MFTPISVSGNSLVNLFLDWNKRKKIKKKNMRTDRIHIKPKKSQIWREKVSIMMFCCGTRKSHHRTRIIRQKRGSASFVSDELFWSSGEISEKSLEVSDELFWFSSEISLSQNNTYMDTLNLTGNPDLLCKKKNFSSRGPNYGSCQLLTLSTLMDSFFWFDTINFG